MKLLQLAAMKSTETSSRSNDSLLAHEQWEEHFMKLSIISQTCNSDPAAALVGFADREGWFPHCDVANAERLPDTLTRARLVGCVALQERRSAIASGTQRPGRGGGPMRFIDDLPTHFAAYSKPAAELVADISASRGQTRWFCCAEEWRCAGPRTSLCGHGDLLFVGITAEFLERQREVAERALKLEPIASVCLGILGVPGKDMQFAAVAAETQSEAALAFKSGSRRLQISGLAAEIEASLSRSAQKKRSADALEQPPGGGLLSVGATCVLDALPVATAALRLTAHATGPSCAPLASLFGVQRMLTTWTYYPLPMTPAHAAVVRDMARVMAGILPMQVRPVTPPRFLTHASMLSTRLCAGSRSEASDLYQGSYQAAPLAYSTEPSCKGRRAGWAVWRSRAP